MSLVLLSYHGLDKFLVLGLVKEEMRVGVLSILGVISGLNELAVLLSITGHEPSLGLL